MPELPEVETTRRGIAPHVVDRRVERIVVRQRSLRWPIPRRLEREMPGQKVRAVLRRAKYLLLVTDGGTALLHLGMSGRLAVLGDAGEPGPHDHVDLVLSGGAPLLRFTDPRRFGCLLWTRGDPLRHRLLKGIGPEPIATGSGQACPEVTSGEDLWRRSRGRRMAVKNYLLDGRVVAGVGNIYASEALWRAGIHPRRAAGRIARARWDVLVGAIQTTLGDALAAGGTTLRDFREPGGAPGYFAQELAVYGREGEPCPACRSPIRRMVLGQRATYSCSSCQT